MSTKKRTVEEIDREIERLKKEYEIAEGTPTEVYTRIVGYYRSVKNWNKGKKEEYRYRRLFCEPSNMIVSGTGITESPAVASATASSETAAPVRETDPGISPSEELPASYLYFYRATCPNCPPVREFVEEMHIHGESINVDTEDGMTAATQYEVLAAPTVIFLDAEGREIVRAHNTELLRELFANTAICA
jgi:ribonucleoside-triphosphate reductase